MRARVLAEAEEETLRAMLYFEDLRQGLGADFYHRVTETVLTIGKEPLQFPLYEGERMVREFRRAPVARLPYINVYEVTEEETLIVAVAHTSQEPGYWEPRD